MKLLTTIVITAVLSGLLGLLMPWWSLAIAAFAVSFFSGLRAVKAFIAGSFGVGLCWLTVALSRDIVNHQLLSSRMASLFHLSGSLSFLAVTVLAGSLVGGLAAMSAAYFRRPATP